jgi:hypothetical protein
MVAECNSLARQPLWAISDVRADPSTLTIRSTAQPARSLELSVQGTAVQCVYGRSAGAGSFALVAEAGTIQIGNQPLTVSQAAAALLDLLVAGL